MVAIALLLVAGDVGVAGEARPGSARVVWKGDYESGDFSQWQGVLRETITGGATIVGKPVSQGRYAAKFVLGPQTDYSGSRIEAHQGNVVPSGGVYGSETWYRWASYVPASTSFARHASFNHLVQWHPALECFGAALSVNGLARPARLLLIIRGGDILRYGGSCDLRYQRAFDLGPLPRDRWLRFRLHIRWHADPSVGFVELWMNGGRKIARTSLATAPPNVHHYVRQGIYRFQCACRTVAFGDAMKVTQVVP
jgi:Polysaccharide lyase